MVFSPIIKIHYTYKDKTLNKSIQGSTGDWRDEDSYIILSKVIRKRENLHFDYDVKITRYPDIDNILYHKTVEVEDIGEPASYSVYFISNKKDVEDLEKIRKSLSHVVARVL